MVKRPVIGAHYGLRDWLAQRITAVVMIIYTILLTLFVLRASGGGYANWQALFTFTWVKIMTLVTVIALLIHAWVGIRDVWMDYLQCAGLRLMMHVLTILWLVASLIYAGKVVWGI